MVATLVSYQLTLSAIIMGFPTVQSLNNLMNDASNVFYPTLSISHEKKYIKHF